ncbi:MAG: Rieske (2Fe-2S) protein [Cyanobacteria bacterium]|nr:Rieske (2Fe-2S) protein [Cyanobacteriota bacterium]
MRRRAFLFVSGAGALLSQMLRPFQARSAQLPQAPQAQESSDLTALVRPVDVASLAQFNKTGQLLIRSSPLGPVLVIRDRATQQLKAVNPICPHRGCLVAWNGSTENFVCPCHQARFNASGRWIGGKAVNRPLASYTVTVSQGRILVSKA